MITIPAGPWHSRPQFFVHKKRGVESCRHSIVALLILAALSLSASLGSAQGSPKVTAVDPATGKVSDSVTVSGEALGKESVAAVFLSDDKSDYKATIVSQSADKIVMKIPEVKPGNYNVSIQVGNGILIEPVRFTVQQ